MVLDERAVPGNLRSVNLSHCLAVVHSLSLFPHFLFCSSPFGVGFVYFQAVVGFVVVPRFRGLRAVCLVQRRISFQLQVFFFKTGDCMTLHY